MTQNGMQFKTYELFISGIFHVIFSDHSWPRKTETVESETTGEGGLLYWPHSHLSPACGDKMAIAVQASRALRLLYSRKGKEFSVLATETQVPY